MAEVEPLADHPQRGPEVAQRRIVQVEHVVDVLIRHDQQVQPGAAVRECVRGDRPVPGLEGDLLAGVLAQRLRAEQADAGRLQPPHLGQLVRRPVVIRAVQAQAAPASAGPRRSRRAQPMLELPGPMVPGRTWRQRRTPEATTGCLA
jgi:hypothetical protein